MAAVGLLYVGAVLFVNGLALVGLVRGTSMIPMNLIWGRGCQGLAGGWMSARLEGSAEGAAGLAVARRVVRLIFAGWVPQDQVSS